MSASKETCETKEIECPISRVCFNKEHSMNLSDTISTCVLILSNILNYTSTIEERTPSSFDVNAKQSEETDSDSDNEVNVIEKNDIEEYIIHCVNYLEIDHHLLVVAMMTLDKILKNNFVLTEKNVHK